MDESLPITFDRSTTSISVWDGEVEIGLIRRIVNTEEARAEVRAAMNSGADSIKRFCLQLFVQYLPPIDNRVKTFFQKCLLNEYSLKSD